MREGHITVVVPVKDRRERMLRCLDAVLAQDHPSYDVIVADNGSSDGTPEACRERAGGSQVQVRVESIEGRVGRVRNEAARLATGEIVAYTDSDCVPSTGWLTAGCRPFADPQVGVVTGKVLPEDPPPYGAWPATLEVREQTWRFESANVLFRRDELLRSGGFDEGLGHFGEDTLAGWAMLEAGWKTEFVPEALVHHDVTYPGFGWQLRRAHKWGKVAAIVARYPQARERLLWRRHFLFPRDAALVAALGGLLLAPRTRAALLLLLPYVRMGWVGVHSRGALRMQAQVVLFDLAVLFGMVRASWRWRRLVL